MATFTSTERAICDKLAYDSSGILAPAKAIKGAVTNQISAAKSALNNYVASPDAVINAAKDTLNNNVGSALPGNDAGDIDRMIDIINNCLYLKDDDALKNPVALGNTLAKSVFDKIDDYVNELTSIPEFLAGKILSALDELFSNAFPGSTALTDLMKKIDKLINCLSNFCGGEYTSQVISLTNETEGLYNNFYMVGDPLSANYGLLDKETLYSEAGLAAGDISKITDVTDEINSVKSNGKKAIDDLVNSTKIAKKAGSILF